MTHRTHTMRCEMRHWRKPSINPIIISYWIGSVTPIRSKGRLPDPPITLLGTRQVPATQVGNNSDLLKPHMPQKFQSTPPDHLSLMEITERIYGIDMNAEREGQDTCEMIPTQRSVHVRGGRGTSGFDRTRVSFTWETTQGGQSDKL